MTVADPRKARILKYHGNDQPPGDGNTLVMTRDGVGDFLIGVQHVDGGINHGTNPPFELRWERPEGTHQIGFYDQRGKAANKPTLGKREANATPLEFRNELLRLAMMAHNA